MQLKSGNFIQNRVISRKKPCLMFKSEANNLEKRSKNFGRAEQIDIHKYDFSKKNLQSSINNH